MDVQSESRHSISVRDWQWVELGVPEEKEKQCCSCGRP